MVGGAVAGDDGGGGEVDFAGGAAVFFGDVGAFGGFFDDGVCDVAGEGGVAVVADGLVDDGAAGGWGAVRLVSLELLSDAGVVGEPGDLLGVGALECLLAFAASAER